MSDRSEFPAFSQKAGIRHTAEKIEVWARNRPLLRVAPTSASSPSSDVLGFNTHTPRVCVTNYVRLKLRQHSVRNTALGNTVFNTVIQRLK